MDDIRPVSKPQNVTELYCEKKMHFKQYCKMLIHNNTVEAQELQLPHATFPPLPPLPLVSLHSTCQGNTEPTTRRVLTKQWLIMMGLNPAQQNLF